MNQQIESENDALKEFNANNAWVAYISPFQIIVPDDEEPFTVSLQEINANTYDHGKLCRIVSKESLPPEDQFKMLICYDGAIAIPKYGAFIEKQIAVDYFNSIMCNLLLGGIFCEALDTRDIVWGQLFSRNYIWPVNMGESVSAQLHACLRTKVAGPMQTIILTEPSQIKLSDFHEALRFGRNVSGTISNFSPGFLVRGITELKYKNWSSVLSNLWITIEQLTDFLWLSSFLGNDRHHPNNPIPGRIKALKNDHRTWSSSVKQEILFQNSILNDYVFEKLFPARQARNHLVHEGRGVDEISAVGAFEAIVGMMEICIPNLDMRIKRIKPILQENKAIKPNTVSSEIDFAEWLSLSSI